MITINDQIAIDESELDFVASRSSGPGGQNVNKVATRVTLRFDLEATEALDPEHKTRIRDRLATRINKNGILSISSQRERSQARNRQAAVDRFAELLRWALETDPERRPTRVPPRARRRRLDHKRRRSRLKKDRKAPPPHD